MDKITPSFLEGWLRTQVKYFRSDVYIEKPRFGPIRTTVEYELKLLKTIFNWYKQEDIYESESRFVDNPVKRKHNKLCFVRAKLQKDGKFSIEQLLAFFSHLQQPYQDLAKLQFYTASRIQEVCGSQFKNFNLKSKSFGILECSLFDKNKKFYKLKEYPKNTHARECYITSEIEEILVRRFKQKLVDHENEGFIFHIDGSPLDYESVKRSYEIAQIKAGFPSTGTHILRHGMAKLARKHGGGLDAVMAVTGHKDRKLADHYSRLDLEDNQVASEKVMSVIRGYEELPHNVHKLDFKAKKLR